MKLIKLSSATLVATIILAGCSSTTVIPQTGDFFTVSTTSSTQEKSYASAVEKAKNVCEQQSANVKIVDTQSIYQGINPSEKSLIKLANKYLADDKNPDSFTPEDHAYKTVITFKCE